jgi:mono/diheme cytochrome c family protein
MKTFGKLLLFILPAAVLFGVFASRNFARSSAANAGLGLSAATTYNQRCASCHGRDGRGQTRKGRQTHARDLTDGAWQDDVSDERLFNSIHNGRGKMPSFRKTLSENEIDALVAHVRRLRR